MDEFEQRLRSHLHGVDAASLPSVDAVLSAADRSSARLQHRRRVVSTSLAAALVVVGGGGLWWTSTREGDTAPADTASPVTTPAGATATDTTDTAVTTAAPTPSDTTAATTPASAPTTAPAGPRSSWTFLPADPRGPTSRPAVVWTGTEAIAFGGIDPEGEHRTESVALDPVSQTWRTLPASLDGFAPDDEHIAVWTGTTALVIGPSGALAYEPDADRWRELAPPPFGAADSDMPWAWNGALLWVWGEVPAVYDPAHDEWTELPAPPIERRVRAASEWSGTEWIVWGGVDLSWTDLADGAAYDPATATWRLLPPAPLSARRVRSAWVGSEMILFGGSSSGTPGTGNGEMAHGDGAAYDRETDSWRRLADGPMHPGHVPVWTGSELVLFAKGFAIVYDPATDTWRDPCCEGEGLAGATPVAAGDVVVLLGSFEPDVGGAILDP